MSDQSAYEDEFGDITPDDVFTDGDADVDWSQVERVQGQVESIDAIEDDDERLAAAKAWAEELGG